ncbi:hypothetical protein ACLOJK_012517 [Asimina triloba]
MPQHLASIPMSGNTCRTPSSWYSFSNDGTGILALRSQSGECIRRAAALRLRGNGNLSSPILDAQKARSDMSALRGASVFLTQNLCLLSLKATDIKTPL